MYHLKGRSDDAIRLLQTARKKAPQKAVYAYHLGMAYLTAGDRRAARIALSEALQLSQDFAGAEETRRVLKGLP
jgi:Flp pilus assembly protein TadD